MVAYGSPLVAVEPVYRLPGRGVSDDEAASGSEHPPHLRPGLVREVREGRVADDGPAGRAGKRDGLGRGLAGYFSGPAVHLALRLRNDNSRATGLGRR